MEWKYDDSPEWRQDMATGSWTPETNPWQHKALVSKIAGLILALPDDYDANEYHEALATNSTHDLESLAYELLEAE